MSSLVRRRGVAAVRPVSGSPPTFGAASSHGLAAAGTTGVTINKPTGTVTGSVLYAFLGFGDDASSTYSCSGWTEVATGQASTGDDRGATILRKIITNGGTEAASYTFVNTNAANRGNAGVIVRVEGAHQTAPEHLVGTVASGGDDFTPAAASITTTIPNTLILTVHMAAKGSLADKTGGAPATYTLAGWHNGESGIVSALVEVAYKTQAAAGATGTDVWTGTPDDALAEFLVCTLAVAPP